MAKEYIERKRAIVDACNSLELYPSEYAELENALNRIPAADVAPVQHGEWIGVDTSYWRWYHDTARTVFSKSFRCSECGRKTIIREKFCPSCGTKMGKEAADGTERTN